MNIYQEASKQKLRFNTTKGVLSTEQLWDLSIGELDNVTVGLENDYKESGKKSFVIKKSEKDKIAKLKFDVALDILTAKVEENELLMEAKSKREHNVKIIELIAAKKDDELKGKSVKELEGMLK